MNSRPLFTIIFKLKNDNFKTRDFGPLIERVLAGVFTYILSLLENEIMYVSNKVHCPCMHIIIQPKYGFLLDAFIRAYNMLDYDKFI